MPDKEPKPHKPDNTTHVGFFLDDSLVKRLDELAKEDDRSRTSYLRLLVERHLKQMKRAPGTKPGGGTHGRS